MRRGAGQSSRLPLAALVPDRTGAIPVHTQIGQWLNAAIAAGELLPRDRLPGERELASRLAVSRMTLRHALADLAAAGVLVRVPGRGGGAFVAEPRLDIDLTELAGLTEQLQRSHRRAGAQVLTLRRTTARTAGEQVGSALGISPGAHVTFVERLRSADGAPLAVERSWLPTRLVPGLVDRSLTGSLYGLLARDYCLAPYRAVEQLTPVPAGRADAELLQIDVDQPVMQVLRTAYTQDGTAVEHACDVFRADRVRFVVRRGPAGAPAVRAEPSD